MNHFQHFKAKQRTCSDICEGLLGLRPITVYIEKKKLFFFRNSNHLAKKAFLVCLFSYLFDCYRTQLGWVGRHSYFCMLLHDLYITTP